MRLWIVSDLHVTSWPWLPSTVPDHDAMVIAGDIADSQESCLSQLFSIRQLTRRPIVFVPGNHDHFGGQIGDFGSRLAGPIYVLPAGESVVVGGVRFVGATLWSDWLLNDRGFSAQGWAARHMPEYQQIKKPSGELIWPIDVSNTHDLHRAQIEAVLAQPFAGSSVVVTHHAPSPQSLHPADCTHEGAGAFASDLETLILRHRPELWVHGHIHDAADYRIGGTRIICNPRGYQALDWSEQTGWLEDLVIDI